MNKILIIEDDINLVENLKEMLELEGYYVETAYNGKIGLEKIENHAPDLIICDISMPVMDGYAVLAHVRSNPSQFYIPFIFLTAKSDKVEYRTGMELGADDYITKPFNNEDVLKSIQMRLYQHSKTQNYYEQRLEELRNNIFTSIPHEFRSPLNTILGFSQLLIDNYQGTDADEAIKMLVSIEKAGRKLLRMVSNFNLYVRLLTSSYETLVSDLENFSSTFDSIHSISNDIARNYSRIEDLHLNLEKVNCTFPDEYFFKITEELIDNAFKFSEKGSEVHINSYNKQNNFIMVIINKTSGIDIEKLKNIGAFSQLNRKHFEQQGSGLGLAIVTKIIEIFNGEISFEKNENNELQVKFTLPCIIEQAVSNSSTI